MGIVLVLLPPELRLRRDIPGRIVGGAGREPVRALVEVLSQDRCCCCMESVAVQLYSWVSVREYCGSVSCKTLP